MTLRFDLFEFYRFLLALLVGVYCVVKLISFLWRWHRFDSRYRWAPLVRRYVVVQLLRIRVRRFVLDFLQIAALALILILLVSRHWW